VFIQTKLNYSNKVESVTLRKVTLLHGSEKHQECNERRTVGYVSRFAGP